MPAYPEQLLPGEVTHTPDGRIFYPIDKIVVDHDFNCRGHISPLDVADLAKDIRENGQIQPVVLQDIPADKKHHYPGKKWILIAGFRRTVGHRVNSYSHIWATIHNTVNEFDARFFNLRENLQRKELTFAQEAAAIAPMVKAKMTRGEIMSKLGMLDGWVQVRVQYLQLPEAIQKEVQAGTITQTNIRQIYTAYLNNGELAAISLTREFKDAKIKGLKADPRKLAKLISRNSKKQRSRAEVNCLNERIMDMFGPSYTTRCMAWIAGEIKDSELEDSLKEAAGDRYIPPEIEPTDEQPIIEE